jgi:hypothetical protein
MWSSCQQMNWQKQFRTVNYVTCCQASTAKCTACKTMLFTVMSLPESIQHTAFCTRCSRYKCLKHFKMHRSRGCSILVQSPGQYAVLYPLEIMYLADEQQNFPQLCKWSLLFYSHSMLQEIFYVFKSGCNDFPTTTGTYMLLLSLLTHSTSLGHFSCCDTNSNK